MMGTCTNCAQLPIEQKMKKSAEIILMSEVLFILLGGFLVTFGRQPKVNRIAHAY